MAIASVRDGASEPSPHHAWPARQAVPCNPALLRLQAARRLLMLQGPVGPFFDRLAVWLMAQGVKVHRIALQGGDLHDSRVLEPIAFHGTPHEWPAFCTDLLQRLDADCLILFGQARHYHRTAIDIAHRLGITVVVLEEGYFRPGYLTMELDGVNGYSNTLKRFHWRADAPGTSMELQRPASTEGQFGNMAWAAIRHYLAMRWQRRSFADYQHHRPVSIRHYSRYWVASWLRKLMRTTADERRLRTLADHDYFFVPLQHDGDAQITHHSPFQENTEFIIQVLRSFALNAPADTLLVFKQHPMSRGGSGHATFIRALAGELGVLDRVWHLVEGHTPTLVAQARGVVVINSTVGLQCLLRKKPLAVLGEALYKLPGLAFQGPLDRFWQACPLPTTEVVEHFLAQVLNLTQVPCNVYGVREESLLWSTRPADQGKMP